MPILQEPIPVGMIVCNEEIDMTEQEIHAMRVAEAVHSARMEGGECHILVFADARDYIEEQNRRTRIG
mgnify:CR=1 FL=1